MLGFETMYYHFDTEAMTLPAPELATEHLAEHQYQLFTALRDETCY